MMPEEDQVPAWILQELHDEAHKFITNPDARFPTLALAIYRGGRDLASSAIESVMKRAASREEAVVSMAVGIHALELHHKYEDGIETIRKAVGPQEGEAENEGATEEEAFIYMAWKLLETNQPRRDRLLAKIAGVLDSESKRQQSARAGRRQ